MGVGWAKGVELEAITAGTAACRRGATAGPPHSPALPSCSRLAALWLRPPGRRGPRAPGPCRAPLRAPHRRARSPRGATQPPGVPCAAPLPSGRRHTCLQRLRRHWRRGAIEADWAVGGEVERAGFPRAQERLWLGPRGVPVEPSNQEPAPLRPCLRPPPAGGGRTTQQAASPACQPGRPAPAAAPPARPPLQAWAATGMLRRRRYPVSKPGPADGRQAIV